MHQRCPVVCRRRTRLQADCAGSDVCSRSLGLVPGLVAVCSLVWGSMYGAVVNRPRLVVRVSVRVEVGACLHAFA